MARKNARKSLADLIDASAETASSAAEVAVVDHSTQISSWQPETHATVAEGETITEADVTELLETLGPEIDAAALEAMIETEAVLETEAAAETPETTDVETFDQLVAKLDPDQVEETVYAIADALDERADFERALAPDNENIQRTIKNARRLMVTKRAAKVLMACSVTPDFINRMLSEGARYNVYALGKVADAMFALTEDGTVSNAINNACMRSLFKFRAAGKVFTGEHAKLAASDKIHCEAALKTLLVRHTVGRSTAPTQASSTMQALTTLGIVIKSGFQKNPCYELSDDPVVAKLEAVLAKAA